MWKWAHEKFLLLIRRCSNVLASEGIIPKRRNLSATEPTSRSASANVYVVSLFALRRGLKSRSRKLLRVFLTPMKFMELIVHGRVELDPI